MTELFSPECLNLTAQSSRTRSTCCPPFPAYSLLSIAEAPPPSISSAVLPAVHVQVHPRFVNLTSRQLFWRFVNFLTFRQLFWHFVNFLTKRQFRKLTKLRYPVQVAFGDVLIPEFLAALSSLAFSQFAVENFLGYTGVVHASNLASRVYWFYTFRFSTTATEKIVLLYDQITYASALS